MHNESAAKEQPEQPKIDPKILGQNPGILVSTPLKGVARYNKKGVYVIVGVVTAVLLTVNTVIGQLGEGATPPTTKRPEEASSGFDRETMWYAKVSFTPGSNGAALEVPNLSEPTPTAVAVSPTPVTEPATAAFPPAQAPGAERRGVSKDNPEELARRDQLLQQARVAGLSADGLPSASAVAPGAAAMPALGAMAANQPLVGESADGDGASEDQNKQKRKERFLRQAKNASDDYHSELRKEPLFEYEVKAGTIIPAVMIGGINSDLPGQVIAQVRENVFDTRSGQAVLIPQGARLIGVYDSQVAYGQERLLLAWNRIIYPDGSSLNLRGMPGMDLSGYTGFSGKVNNHYGKIFGSVILMSLIGTGVQLSQPETSDKKSFSRALGESLAQQLGQTATQMTQKNLNIQPTIEIAPGYQFNVMVTADLVLPPMESGQ